TWRLRRTVKRSVRRHRASGSATGMPTRRHWSPPQRASAAAERRGPKGVMTTVRRSDLAVLLLLAAALGGCTVDTATDALGSLGASRFSTTYHSGFWAAEAKRKSLLWAKAQSY